MVALWSMLCGASVSASVCLIQSLVPLWEWNFYRPASCLLMISINLDSPADSQPSNTKCDSLPTPFIVHRLQTVGVGVCHI